MQKKPRFKGHLICQKGDRYSAKLSGMLLLVVALLICYVPAARAVEETISDTEASLCKGLKPFKNLDELLYQFYINLDSDCLFEMPVAELEKVWEIKILSEERVRKLYEKWETKPYSDEKANLSRARFQLSESYDFKNKPYKSEKDAFFVEKGRTNITDLNYFLIQITKEYNEIYATLFPDGNYPRLLPVPRKEWMERLSVHHWSIGESPRHKNKGMYDPYSYYYWLNSDQTRMISLGGLWGVTEVLVRDYVFPDMLRRLTPPVMGGYTCY